MITSEHVGPLAIDLADDELAILFLRVLCETSTRLEVHQ
jgi:hypothetical protein